MQPVTGCQLKPDRGNKAPGITDPSRSRAQHVKSPVASSQAAQPALPGLCLRQVKHDRQNSHPNCHGEPRAGDQPLHTQTHSTGQQCGPIDTAPSRPPAMPSRRRLTPTKARLPAGICRALVQLQCVRCCVGRETDSARGKSTFGGGNAEGCLPGGER